MKCSRCGAQNQSNNFCVVCGNKLNNNGAAQNTKEAEKSNGVQEQIEKDIPTELETTTSPVEGQNKSNGVPAETQTQDSKDEQPNQTANVSETTVNNNETANSVGTTADQEKAAFRFINPNIPDRKATNEQVSSQLKAAPRSAVVQPQMPVIEPQIEKKSQDEIVKPQIDVPPVPETPQVSAPIEQEQNMSVPQEENQNINNQTINNQPVEAPMNDVQQMPEVPVQTNMQQQVANVPEFTNQVPMAQQPNVVPVPPVFVPMPNAYQGQPVQNMTEPQYSNINMNNQQMMQPNMNYVQPNTNNKYGINSFVANPALYDDGFDVNENDLLSAYINKNVAKMKGGFSWCTLFFGYAYMFYRKMWLLGAILLVLTILLSSLPIVLLCITVYFAIIFKSTYVKNATNQVKKIVMDHPNTSQKDLQYICYKKGGTAWWVILVFGVLPATIILISTLVIFFNGVIFSGKTRDTAMAQEAENYSVAANVWRVTEQFKDKDFDASCVKISTLEKSGFIKSPSYRGYIEFAGDNQNRIYITDGKKGIDGVLIKELDDNSITYVYGINIPSNCK